MAELKNIALLALIIAVIKNAYAYPACYEENCCCEPPRCCERPVSYLPVPQPLPIRVPVPRPCCQPPSVTIPNIILALLPPTGNKVGGSPYGKQGGVGYGRFGHGFGHGLGHGFGHGYGHGCGFGHGFGHGLGHGFGHGYGHGCGFGHGFGHSCGCYSTGCCGC